MHMYMYLYLYTCACVCSCVHPCVGVAIGVYYTPPHIHACACTHRQQTSLCITCSYGTEKEPVSSLSPLLPLSLQTLSGSLCGQWFVCVYVSVPWVACEYSPGLHAGE